nr:MAG TPA: hypothetical protein [Caudoviricetes sp.]
MGKGRRPSGRRFFLFSKHHRIEVSFSQRGNRLRHAQQRRGEARGFRAPTKKPSSGRRRQCLRDRPEKARETVVNT